MGAFLLRFAKDGQYELVIDGKRWDGILLREIRTTVRPHDIQRVELDMMLLDGGTIEYPDCEITVNAIPGSVVAYRKASAALAELRSLLEAIDPESPISEVLPAVRHILACGVSPENHG